VQAVKLASQIVDLSTGFWRANSTAYAVMVRRRTESPLLKRTSISEEQ
jgi:hypothetical protein